MMFELYTQSHKKSTKQKQASDRDIISDIAIAVGKLLQFFIIEPYKSIIYRIKRHPKYFKYLVLVQLIAAPFFIIFLDEAVVRFFIVNNINKIIPDWSLHFRLPIFLYLVSHVYFLFMRLPWMRKEAIYNQKFKELGLVPKSRTKKIKLLDEYKTAHDLYKMVLSNPGLPLDAYKEKQLDIDSMFNFQVTDIEFGKTTHTICITYRKKAFPKMITSDEFYKDLKLKPYEFGIGTSLSGKKIVYNLKNMVHLLVAGETGGGKSTFLRQFIVDCLKSKKPIHLYLVDLKGGVEFQPFAEYKRATLVKEFKDTSGILEILNNELDQRLKLLEENKVNNIEAYEVKENKMLSRIVLVIDECAEIFLQSSSQDRATKLTLGTIRFKLGRLARLSRAVGIHLVLATQRADKGAIDMQTKDNLVSRLCFRVNNDYASQMVLRDGRAARLPKIQGRAIWKEGNTSYEVQVPFLDQKDVHNMLKSK